jgi:hypothetical protein
MACPTLNELLDYARRLSSATDAETLLAHLRRGCAPCADNVQWLEQVTGTAASDRSFDFAEEHIQGLVMWFKAQRAHAPRALRQVVAELIFDSLNPAQLAPVRAEIVTMPTPASGRQMLYRTDGYDIDLRFEARDDQISEDLIGQVLAQTSAFSEATVVLTRAHGEMRSHRVAQTDGQGLFRFGRLPSGVYDVTIRVAGDEIKLPSVMTAYCY